MKWAIAGLLLLAGITLACIPPAQPIGCSAITDEQAAYLTERYPTWYVAASEIPWHPEAKVQFMFSVGPDGAFSFAEGPWLQIYGLDGSCVQWSNPYWEGP